MQSENGKPETTEDRARALVARWEHGDEKHREWLRETAVPDIIALIQQIHAESFDLVKKEMDLMDAAQGLDEMGVLDNIYGRFADLVEQDRANAKA